jgi:hypothetical protein
MYLVWLHFLRTVVVHRDVMRVPLLHMQCSASKAVGTLVLGIKHLFVMRDTNMLLM